MKCACDPGSDANGWHETRCAACQEIDLEQWRLLLDGWRKRYAHPMGKS